MVSTGLGLPENTFLDAGRYGCVLVEDARPRADR